MCWKSYEIRTNVRSFRVIAFVMMCDSVPNYHIITIINEIMITKSISLPHNPKTVTIYRITSFRLKYMAVSDSRLS